MNPRRIARERRTIRAMMSIYCRAHHGSRQLCPECGDLLQYACDRIDRCPFGAEKTACSQCQVHCYQLQMRQRIRQVMRFAGPRMLVRHPVLALLHRLGGKAKGTAR